MNSLPSFEPIASRPAKLLNFSVGVLLLLPIVFLFFAVFTFLQEDNIVAALCLFILLFITVILIAVHSINVWKRIYTTIIIDEKGLRFLNKFNNKVVKEISWKSFVKRKRLATDFENLFDITTELPHKGIYACFVFYLLVGKETVRHTEIFHSNHIFCALYSNRLKLIRSFLLGLRHFRSDLFIDPKIFDDHFIDQETFIINYKKRAKLFVLISTLILLLTIFIWFLID